MSAPGRWLVVEVRAPSEALVAALSEGLVAAGGSAVQEVDGALRTWLPDPVAGPDVRPEEALDTTPREAAAAPQAVLRVLDRVAAALEAALGEHAAEAVPGALRWWWAPQEDWGSLWRRGLGPRRAGRVVVAPTWSQVEAGPDDVVVRIDPKMAFGTGEHATTRGVLRLLQGAGPAGARVLDVGAGSAVLAIAAARLGAASVRAVEADGDALDNARENVALNDVEGRVRVEHALVDAAWLAAEAGPGFDVILANVLSSVLVPLLPAFRAALRPGGHLILGGILATEAEEVRGAAAGAALAVVAEAVEGEWWSGHLRPA